MPTSRPRRADFLKTLGGTLLASSSSGEDDATIQTKAATVIVEKLPDLANLAAGVLVLGQFVGEEPASVWRMILGAALWTGLAGVTLLIAGGES